MDIVGVLNADPLLANLPSFCFTAAALFHHYQDRVLDILVVLFLLEGEEIVEKSGSNQSWGKKLPNLILLFIGYGNTTAESDETVPEP